MADTLGSLIDKLQTVDLKMWNNQEILYKIRRMNLDEFKTEYFSEEGVAHLFELLNKSADLNVQRNQLIDEIDAKVIEIAQAATKGEDLDNGKFIQRKHKTY